jgi:PAS domain-containing protein
MLEIMVIIEEIIKLESHVFTSGESIFNKPIIVPGTQNTGKGLISIVPVFDESNSVINIIVSIIELTPIMYTIRHNKVIKAIMNLLQDEVIWVWNDTLHQTVFIGKQIENLIGWTYKEVMENNYDLFSRIIHPDDIHVFKKNELGTANSKCQFRIYHKNGNLITFESSSYKIMEDDEIYYIIICRIKK